MKMMSRPSVNGRPQKWPIVLILIVTGVLAAACGALGGRTDRGRQPFVDSVEIEETAGGQYVAVVQGNYPDLCSTTGAIDQEVQGRTIVVTIYSDMPEDAFCAQVLTPFEERITLDVEGLSPGQYTVSVNGTVTTLTLT